MLPPSLQQWGTSPNLHNWFFRGRIWQIMCAAAGRSLASALGLLQPQAGLTLAARPRSRWPRSPCECSLVTPQLFLGGIGTSFLAGEYMRCGAIWKGSFCDLRLASRTYFSSSLLVSDSGSWPLVLSLIAGLWVPGCVLSEAWTRLSDSSSSCFLQPGTSVSFVLLRFSP